MPKAKKVSSLIKTLAEWAVDDALASHDAGYPPRKRLPMEHYKKRLAEEAQAKTKAKPKARRQKTKT